MPKGTTFVEIKKLNNKEIPYAERLLKENGLPGSDIKNEMVKIFSIHQDDQSIGIIGFEQYGKHGLLRSFAIEKEYQSKGFGAQALNKFEALASEQGIEEFYLLTTTADKFFAQNGYEIYERNSVPTSITNTKEFDSICPTSAVCMRKKLKTVSHF